MCVVNIPLIALLRRYTVPEDLRVTGSGVPATLLFMILSAALIAAAAQVTRHLLEKHCPKLKRYFTLGEDSKPKLGSLAG